MFALLLSLGAALLWGTADFSGGRASRGTAAGAVVALSQVIGLPVVALLAVASGGGWPSAAGIGWGVGAGMLGFAALTMFYRILAGGMTAVAAPTSGLVCVCVPLAVGLATQHLPGVHALVGAALAVPAVVLLGMTGGPLRDAGMSGVIARSLCTGLMFGLALTFLAEAGDGAGVGPLIGARIGSLTLGAAVLPAACAAARTRAGMLRWTVLTGVADISGTGLYLAATRHGLLTVVAPLSSLYPAVTVLLGLLVDRETLRPVQAAGLGLACLSVVLIAG